MARANAAKAGLENVTLRRMDSTALRLPDECFDAVISSFGLPGVPWDIQPALVEWRRVLVPGGRLSLCTEAEDPLAARFQKVFAKYKVRNPSPELAERRRLVSRASREAARVSATGGRFLESAGFIGVRHSREAFQVTIPARAQLEVLLTSGIDYAEYAELARPVRGRFRREAMEAIRPFETSKGEVDFFLAGKPGP